MLIILWGTVRKKKKKSRTESINYDNLRETVCLHSAIRKLEIPFWEPPLKDNCFRSSQKNKNFWNKGNLNLIELDLSSWFPTIALVQNDSNEIWKKKSFWKKFEVHETSVVINDQIYQGMECLNQRKYLVTSFNQLQEGTNHHRDGSSDDSENVLDRSDSEFDFMDYIHELINSMF
jgi:hypothetical protein